MSFGKQEQKPNPSKSASPETNPPGLFVQIAAFFSTEKKPTPPSQEDQKPQFKSYGSTQQTPYPR